MINVMDVISRAVRPGSGQRVHVENGNFRLAHDTCGEGMK